ncbi:hypothetical protein GCM10023184_04990 [Flaviaesturariibacter amylovorans]|uniref:Uncharacterized protein n=1 Tax=Flaviaesturariibacter amylovorans TaxID=1084520 RepID=A0ABP8G9M9_9BACT
MILSLSKGPALGGVSARVARRRRLAFPKGQRVSHTVAPSLWRGVSAWMARRKRLAFPKVAAGFARRRGDAKAQYGIPGVQQMADASLTEFIFDPKSEIPWRAPA